MYGHSQNANLHRALPLIQRMRPAHWHALDPDPADAQAVTALGVKLIVRRHWRYDFGDGAVRADMQAGRTPEDAAREFVASCAAQDWYPFAWGITTPPAMAGQWSPDILPWAIRFQSACVALFAAHGKSCLVSNTPTGNDGYYVPGARYYAAQEYRWDDGGDWLHYRSWWPSIKERQPDARLFLTEVGYTALRSTVPVQADGGAPHGADVGFRGGYGVDGIPADRVAALLAVYAAQLRRDGVTGFWFQVGGNEDWQSHEALGTPVEEWMVTQEAPAPSPDDFARWGRVMPEFLFGFKAKADDLGAAVVGAPLADEEYLGNDFSYQFAEKGLFVYSKKANRVLFLPART